MTEFYVVYSAIIPVSGNGIRTTACPSGRVAEVARSVSVVRVFPGLLLSADYPAGK